MITLWFEPREDLSPTHRGERVRPHALEIQLQWRAYRSTSKRSRTDHPRKTRRSTMRGRNQVVSSRTDVLLISGAGTVGTLSGKLIRQALEPIRLDHEPPGATPPARPHSRMIALNNRYKPVKDTPCMLRLELELCIPHPVPITVRSFCAISVLNGGLFRGPSEPPKMSTTPAGCRSNVSSKTNIWVG